MPEPSPRDPYDVELFRTSAIAAAELLAEHLREAREAPESMPVLPASDPASEVERWTAKLRETNDPASLFAELLERSHHLHHPRYMGHQVSAPAPVAAVADLVASVLNNGLAIYEMGPVGLAVERACVAWMNEKLGFGAGADGFFTSGGSLGNLTALLAARQAKAGWDVWTEGAGGGPPLAVLVSEEAHYCVARAAQVMGFGAGGVGLVETDAKRRVTRGGLEAAHQRAERAGRKAIALVASCCTTSTGSYDPLGVCADFAEERGLWLHVDGAHGASAAISPTLRDRVAGIERADSVVWDAHKLLGVPSLSTAVLFRDGRRSHEALAQSAGYLLDDSAQENWWDGARRTIECTRRLLSLPLYTLLACCGEAALARHVDRLHESAVRLASIIEQTEGFELAMAPELNIVCFRHVPAGASPEDLDAMQIRLRDRVVREGSFFIVRTTLGGRVWLRCTLMNPHTSEADLRALLARLKDHAGATTAPA